MGDYWIARNPGELAQRLERFRIHLEERNEWPICWQAKRYTDPRTMDQNALLHVWCGEFAKHVLDKGKVSEAEKEGMRITLQRHCYADTHWDWLIEEVPDLFTGETRTQRRSTTRFDKGEMTAFLDWIQRAAADRGLILESMGEYRELQERQVA
jgi:hypothetical protein